MGTRGGAKAVRHLRADGSVASLPHGVIKPSRGCATDDTPGHSIGVHHDDLVQQRALSLREGKQTAVRRPCRPIVACAISGQTRCNVAADREGVELGVSVSRALERDRAAVRSPRGVRVSSARQSAPASTARIDRVDLGSTMSNRVECDLSPVWRPRWMSVVFACRRQSPLLPAVGADRPDCVAAASGLTVEHDRVAVRRPLRRTIDGGVVGQTAGRRHPAVGQVELVVAVSPADEDDSPAVRRPRRVMSAGQVDRCPPRRPEPGRDFYLVVPGAIRVEGESVREPQAPRNRPLPRYKPSTACLRVTRRGATAAVKYQRVGSGRIRQKPWRPAQTGNDRVFGESFSARDVTIRGKRCLFKDRGAVSIEPGTPRRPRRDH